MPLAYFLMVSTHQFDWWLPCHIIIDQNLSRSVNNCIFLLISVAAPVTPTSFSMNVRGHLCPAVMFILILPNNSPSRAFRKPGPMRSARPHHAAVPHPRKWSSAISRQSHPELVFDIFDLQTCVYFELVIWSWY